MYVLHRSVRTCTLPFKTIFFEEVSLKLKKKMLTFDDVSSVYHQLAVATN